MRRSRHLTLLVGLLALSLTAASSCNQKPAQSSVNPTPSPGKIATPLPIPRSPTLRPGQPTPLPDVPW